MLLKLTLVTPTGDTVTMEPPSPLDVDDFFVLALTEVGAESYADGRRRGIALDRHEVAAMHTWLGQALAEGEAK